jgi:hypothetical protein
MKDKLKVDLSALDFGAWGGILYKWRKDIPIEKLEIENLLRGEDPIPQAVRPLLADVVSGKYKFKRARKAHFLTQPLPSMKLARSLVVAQVEFVEKEIENPSIISEPDFEGLNDPAEIDELKRNHQDYVIKIQKAAKKKCIGRTARDLAKELVAEEWGLCVRTLEGF